MQIRQSYKSTTTPIAASSNLDYILDGELDRMLEDIDSKAGIHHHNPNSKTSTLLRILCRKATTREPNSRKRAKIVTVEPLNKYTQPSSPQPNTLGAAKRPLQIFTLLMTFNWLDRYDSRRDSFTPGARCFLA
jgi:hypothetical protein